MPPIFAWQFWVGAAALAALVTGRVGGIAGHDSAQAVSSCPLENTDSAVTMTLPASWVFDRTDTAADPNVVRSVGGLRPRPQAGRLGPRGWGSRPHCLRHTAAQPRLPELTVIDGNNPDGDGERCELGKNSYVDGIAGLRNPAGTFYNYDEGQRRATHFSLRLPSNLPSLRVTYSQDPNVGRIKVYVDLNGNGDFDDAGEQTQTFHPSHLRMGIYHDPAIACPTPSGCPVNIDNVEAAKP